MRRGLNVILANKLGNIVGIVIKIKRGDKDLPVMKKRLSKDSFFSATFPVWIGKKLSGFEGKKKLRFRTFYEDSLNTGFKTVNGHVQKTKPDEYALETKTTRLLIRLDSIKAIWWVHDNGSASRILAPNGRDIRITTKAKALKFLDGDAAK